MPALAILRVHKELERRSSGVQLNSEKKVCGGLYLIREVEVDKFFLDTHSGYIICNFVEWSLNMDTRMSKLLDYSHLRSKVWGRE